MPNRPHLDALLNQIEKLDRESSGPDRAEPDRDRAAFYRASARLLAQRVRELEGLFEALPEAIQRIHAAYHLRGFRNRRLTGAQLEELTFQRDQVEALFARIEDATGQRLPPLVDILDVDVAPLPGTPEA